MIEERLTRDVPINITTHHEASLLMAHDTARMVVFSNRSVTDAQTGLRGWLRSVAYRYGIDDRQRILRLFNVENPP